MEAFFDVLCRSSITEAFLFSRARGEQIHKILLKRLITFALSGRQGADRESRSIELVTIPLSVAESSWVQEHFGIGGGRQIHGAADTLVLRSLTTGRFDLIRESSNFQHDRSINGLNWARLTRSIGSVFSKDGLTV